MIDVDPNFVDDDTTLKVLLHEIAHIKGDYSWMPVTYDHLAPAGSVKVSTAARSSWRAGKPEHAADAMAARWMAYANQHYHEYDRPGFTTFGRKLLALINMKGV